MDVVIPAAGIGSRFLPVSRSVPKELLPLGVKPLIHHALEEAERAGFARAVVVISREKAAIRSYFESDPTLDSLLVRRGEDRAAALLREAEGIAKRLKVTFVEQPAPLGLGDAVLRCRDVCSEPFAVLLPDDVVLTSLHWAELLRTHGQTSGACFCVRTVPPAQIQRFGIVACEPTGEFLRVNSMLEKPQPDEACSNLAIFGRYVVTAHVLEALSTARSADYVELQLTAGFAAIVDKPPGVFAVGFTDDFFDNGTPEEYARSAARYAAAFAPTAA